MTVFSHSGDFGEVIALLPVVQQKGGGKIVLFPARYTGCRMTPHRAGLLAPLLSAQPYVTGVEWKDAPEGLNLGVWRNHHRPGRNLTDAACDYFEVPPPPREQPWLFAAPKPAARVVLHRSRRDHNWNFPWRAVYETYRRDAVFVGHPDEHADFEAYCGPVAHARAENMLDLARVVAGAELFVGNRSGPFWVAEGLKVPTVLEVARDPDDCRWDRCGAVHGTGADVALPAPADLADRLVKSVAARAKGHTVIAPERLVVFGRQVREAARLPGDMAELGVYKGGSAKVIAGLAPGKTLHLFDTFQGLPADDVGGGTHKKGEFTSDADRVRAFLAGHDVRFYVGRFPDTTAAVPADARFCFAHLDGDLYQSTVDAIDFFWPRMVPGGVMLFDDYGWKNCPGVARAVAEKLPGVPLERGPLQAWVRRAG